MSQTFEMSSLRFFLAVALLVFFVLTPRAEAIVNAVPVSDRDFAATYPWAVVVVNKVGGGICGGVLVAPRWVLTAAHCTSANRYVLVGSARQDRGTQVDVERAIRHPGFSIDTLQNDVGLLYLAEPQTAPLAPLVTPVEMRLLLRPNGGATIIGWGKTESSREPVNRLREAHIRLQELILSGSQMAYRYTSGPCGRDSGAPMLMQTLDGRPVVVGVASSTEGNLCSTGGGLAVYTNLARVKNFILQYLQAEAASTDP